MTADWLVTVRRGADLRDVEKRLPADVGNLSLQGPAIPMGPDEEVLEIKGPRDLDRILETDDKVLSVHRSSKMRAF